MYVITHLRELYHIALVGVLCFQDGKKCSRCVYLTFDLEYGSSECSSLFFFVSVVNDRLSKTCGCFDVLT